MNSLWKKIQSKKSLEEVRLLETTSENEKNIENEKNKEKKHIFTDITLDQEDDLKNKKKIFWKLIIISLISLFVAESSRGIVVPSLYLYVQSLGGTTKFLGFVISAFSIGRLCSSVPLGWWYNKKGAKNVLLICFFLCIIGNFIFSLASLMVGSVGLWILFLSRLIIGIGTGTLGVIRAEIAAITTNEQRTRYFAWSSAIQFIGFAIPPGIAGLIFSLINFNIGSFSVNQFTLPGIFLMIINIIMFFVVWWKYPLQEEKLEISRIIESRSNNNETEKNFSTKKPTSSKKIIYIGIFGFIILNFVARGILAILETNGSPVFMSVWESSGEDTTEETVKDTSNMLLSLGVIGVLILFLTVKLRVYIAEQILLVISFAFLGIGSLLLIDYGNMTLTQFLFGATLIWSVGSPISQTLTLSTFSKILGSKPQGTMMGWITSAGSIARILLPNSPGFLGNNISFILSAIFSFLSGTFVLLYDFYVKKIQKSTNKTINDIKDNTINNDIKDNDNTINNDIKDNDNTINSDIKDNTVNSDIKDNTINSDIKQNDNTIRDVKDNTINDIKDSTVNETTSIVIHQEEDNKEDISLLLAVNDDKKTDNLYITTNH